MPDGTLSPLDGFGALDDPNVALSVEIGDDGKVELSAPAVHTKDDAPPETFNDNLAEHLEGSSLLGYDLAEGIESDISSRKGLTQQYADGMALLGLEVDGADSSKNTRNTKGRSRVGHPLLLAAIVDGQSAASGELLPSTGPCKVMTRDGDTQQEDDLGDALANDMNWYLTTGAREYYPDMDRGLFSLFYSGNMFKAVYDHPIRQRPVAEVISTDDLIVSEDATDLDTAIRITQRNEMSPQEVRRMQWADVWLDVPLGQPMQSEDEAQRAKAQTTGVQRNALRPKDQPHTIYQCTTDLVLGDHGWDDPLAPGDLPVSYRVTMDKDTKTILAVNRSWRPEDKMFQRKQRYVHYGMVPGFGFLCLGYLHLLGNQTKALRAIWRLLIDAGMFSNFPGGMKAKGVRTSTNEIDPAPGEWKDVDISGFDRIQDAFMAMPYKGPDAVFIQLAELIGKESAAIAGAAKMPVGDSRVDIPVGTMLALIEQATKMDSAIHKRLYRSQARELEMLKECFAENPQTLAKLNPNPQYQWRTRAEIMDQELVPAADPNVPSQIHRIMLNTAMVTVAGQNPDIYDRPVVHKRAWNSMGIRDTDSFLHEPQPNQGPPPDPIKQGQLQLGQQKLQQGAQDQQRKAATEAVDAATRQKSDAADLQMRAAELASTERQKAMEQETERLRLAAEESRSRRQLAHDAAATTLEHARHGEEMVVKRQVAAKPVPAAAKGKTK